MKNSKDTILCTFCNRKAVVMYYAEVLHPIGYLPRLSAIPICRIHDLNALRCWNGAKVFKD